MQRTIIKELGAVGENVHLVALITLITGTRLRWGWCVIVEEIRDSDLFIGDISPFSRCGEHCCVVMRIVYCVLCCWIVYCEFE